MPRIIIKNKNGNPLFQNFLHARCTFFCVRISSCINVHMIDALLENNMFHNSNKMNITIVNILKSIGN